MIGLTQEVINSGGSGMIYWEPAWVSSDCFTQWVKGSRYENATFFDFDNNLINSGGIGFMQHDYENLSAETAAIRDYGIQVIPDSSRRRLILQFGDDAPRGIYGLMVVFQGGREVFSGGIKKQGQEPAPHSIEFPLLSAGIYVVVVCSGIHLFQEKRYFFNRSLV